MLTRENNLHNHRLETSVKQIIERQVGLREGVAFPSQLIPSLIRQAMLARENNLHNHRLETSVKQIIERQVGLREGVAFPSRYSFIIPSASNGNSSGSGVAMTTWHCFSRIRDATASRRFTSSSAKTSSSKRIGLFR